MKKIDDLNTPFLTHRRITPRHSPTIEKRPGLISSGQVFQEVLPVSGNGPTLQESMEPGKIFS